MSIRRLPDELVNRIAAGEVVERPASVVKELVENALDAGARRIVVTTAGGGKSLLRIEDDGHGMDETDLALCIERHATSKLLDDGLDDIRTLGFRGEALASIGAVSDLSVASRRRDMTGGLMLEMRRGKLLGIRPEAMNPGTRVEVRNLFAAVPARLKFLKSDRAEAGAIADTVRRLAMANPEVHFRLEGSDRQPLNWPGQAAAGGLRARVAQALGADFIANAAEIAFERDGMVIAGFAGLPTYTRANSLGQFYFVNGRTVRDKVLLGAVRGAYADLIFRDRFPVLVLFISIPPAEVDVNVHPAKAELRFRDAGGVRGAVIRAIGGALEAAGFKASSTVAEAAFNSFRAPAHDPLAPVWQESRGVAPTAAGGWQDWAAGSTPAALSGLAEPSARFTPEAPAGEAAADYPLGVARAQIFANYIVAQSEDSLLLVDQHAAHERLVYERFKAQLAAGPVAAQAHLIPVVVDLTEEDCDRLEAEAPTLERLGLIIERFGPAAVAVSATPAVLGSADVTPLVRDLADSLAEWGSNSTLSDSMDAVIARMACHGSVRSGRQLRVDEMNALLREMEATPHSGQCIHGRPTYVELKKGDLERLFGRR